MISWIEIEKEWDLTRPTVAGIYDQAKMYLSTEQSNPIDPDYAEFKAWKENKDKRPSAYPNCPLCGDDGYWICPECEKKFTPKYTAPLAPKPEAKTEEGVARTELMQLYINHPTYKTVERFAREMYLILSRHPQAPLPFPLEELARRKGRELRIVMDSPTILLDLKSVHTEKEARAYLEGLKDVKEGK